MVEQRTDELSEGEVEGGIVAVESCAAPAKWRNGMYGESVERCGYAELRLSTVKYVGVLCR